MLAQFYQERQMAPLWLGAASFDRGVGLSRDTGQIMFDLSVPVFVADRHWGGFRVGYSLE